MQIIYSNKRYQSFVEFDIETQEIPNFSHASKKEEVPVELIIDAALKEILQYGKCIAGKIIEPPSELLEALVSDKEVDLFMLAEYSAEKTKELRNCFYVPVPESLVLKYMYFHTDEEHKVEAIGQDSLIVSKQKNFGGLSVAAISNQELDENFYSIDYR